MRKPTVPEHTSSVSTAKTSAEPVWTDRLAIVVRFMQPLAHCAATAGSDLPVLLYFFPFRGLWALRKLSPHRVFIPAILLQPQLLMERTHQCVGMKRLFSSRSCIVDIGFLTSCWPPFTTTAKPLPFLLLLALTMTESPPPTTHCGKYIVANVLVKSTWLRPV